MQYICMNEMNTKNFLGRNYRYTDLKKNISKENERFAPVKALIVTSCIWKQNDKTFAESSYHYQSPKFIFIKQVTV